MEETYKYKDITELIIKAYYAVYSTLGCGFLEKVYVAALMIEMQKLGLKAAQNVAIAVYYGEQMVGEYFADVVVAGVVIVEVKAARTLAMEHEAQLLNYLRATPYEVGLLLNFGPKAQFKCLAYDNSRKPTMTWKKT